LYTKNCFKLTANTPLVLALVLQRDKSAACVEFRIIKSRRLWWVGNREYLSKYEEKRRRGRLMRRWDLNEIKQEGMDWNQLTQVRQQWPLFCVG